MSNSLLTTVLRCIYTLNRTKGKLIVSMKMFNVRVPEKLLEGFKEHAVTELKIEPSELVREMMSAVIDGRLRMKQDTEKKEALEKLYVD